MAQKAKDRFRDWNLYHKCVVVFIASLFLWLVVHAAFAYDGAFKVRQEKTVPADAAQLWSWMVATPNRHRWMAELVDISELAGTPGESGATSLLFWKRGPQRWHATETLTESLPGRLYVTYQESDKDRRWLRLELVPHGPCETQVHMEEILFPVEYRDRFWFFLEEEDHEKRLQSSLTALHRWADAENLCDETAREG